MLVWYSLYRFDNFNLNTFPDKYVFRTSIFLYMLRPSFEVLLLSVLLSPSFFPLLVYDGPLAAVLVPARGGGGLLMGFPLSWSQAEFD